MASIGSETAAPLHAAQPPPPPSGGSASSPATINVAASLRKHPKVALIVAAVVLMLGAPMAWVLGTPKYSATAVIYVSPHFLSNLADSNDQKFDSVDQYREYVEQNAKTINRFDIVLEALKRVGGLQSAWVGPGETLEHAAERLQGALTISPVSGTYQITITLEGKRKNGLAEIVNSVADTYLEKAKAEEFFGSDQRVQSLTEDRVRLQKEIAEKQARRMTLAQELGVSSFLESDENPYDQLLVTAKAAQSDARKEAIQAETQFAVFDEKQDPNAKQSLHAFAFDEAYKDPVLASVITTLNVRRTEVLASLRGTSADHPGRAAAERELADIEKEREAAIQTEVDALSKNILDNRAAQAHQARQVERQMTAEVERQASQAAWFTRGYQEGIQLGRDVDEARKADDSLRERIDYFTLEKNAPGYVRLFSPARPPDQPFKGGRKLFAAVFFVFAVVLAVAVPVGIDFLDPRLRSPGQAEALLGFPLTAWLMEKPDAGAAFAREQILHFANRIVQENQSNNSRIFTITSVKSGGGTSTIVLETARALNGLGLATLAVEANALRSDARYTEAHSRGLDAVLSGSRTLRMEIVPGDGELPDRVPVGEITQGKNLPNIKNLEENLRRAAQDYDLVLVDAPPVLASVDTEMIARTADVVVLVIEAGAVTKEELRRTVKILKQLDLRTISALLNRVRRDEASGVAATAIQEFEAGSATQPRSFLARLLWR